MDACSPIGRRKHLRPSRSVLSLSSPLGSFSMRGNLLGGGIVTEVNLVQHEVNAHGLLLPRNAKICSQHH